MTQITFGLIIPISIMLMVVLINAEKLDSTSSSRLNDSNRAIVVILITTIGKMIAEILLFVTSSTSIAKIYAKDMLLIIPILMP